MISNSELTGLNIHAKFKYHWLNDIFPDMTYISTETANHTTSDATAHKSSHFTLKYENIYTLKVY